MENKIDKINMRPKDESNVTFKTVNRYFSYLAILRNENPLNSLNLLK